MCSGCKRVIFKKCVPLPWCDDDHGHKRVHTLSSFEQTDDRLTFSLVHIQYIIL